MAWNQLRCFGVILLAVVCYAAEKEKSSALVGSTATLQCTIDRKSCGEMHSMKWYKNDSRVYVFSESGTAVHRQEGEMGERLKVNYKQNSNHVELLIDSVKAEDEGLYRCEFTYLQVGENCETVQLIDFKTFVLPKEVRIQEKDGTALKNGSIFGPIIEGRESKVQCTVLGGKPTPEVVWYLNGDEKAGEKSTQTVGDDIEVTNTLTLSGAREDLGAKLECEVSSEALEKEIVSTISVDVNVRPTKIAITGVEHHVVEGTVVTLMCTVSGAKPAANITWYNGTEIVPEESQHVQGDQTYDTTSKIIFPASRFENNLAFRCEAENEVMRTLEEESLVAKKLLEVKYPPVVHVSPGNITIMENQDVLLICTYEANPSTLTQVIWYKDGKQIVIDEKGSHYQGGTIEQPALQIKSVTGDDMGTYTCELANDIGNGTSEESIELDVLFVPTVELLTDVEGPVIEGSSQNITLTCYIVSGNPEVLIEVSWYLNGELLKKLPECNETSNESITLCDQVDPAMLLLQGASRNFHGNFTCEGRNIAGWGNRSEETELVVYYPPGQARISYFPQRVVKGQYVTLNCSVDEPGRPVSNRFRWSRDNYASNEIVTSQWTIDPVTLETRSNFSCRGRNDGGFGSPAFTKIEVYAPPSFIHKLDPYTGFLYSSKNISLKCTVECYPRCGIEWLKNNVLIKPSETDLYIVEEAALEPDAKKNDFEATRSILTFNMSAWPGNELSRVYDTANYTCRSGSNHVGPGVQSTTLFAVEYKPENITVSSQNVSVNEGTAPNRVFCSARGNPEPSYIWRKADEGSGSSDEESQLEDEVKAKGNILILHEVSREDAGDIVCEAYNKHGSVRMSTYINVLYKPECSIKQIEIDGDQYLACTANANPPYVSFTWSLKSENDTLSENELITEDGSQSLLKLDSSVELFRTYLCRANNSVGDSKYCEMDVAGTKVWWKDSQKIIIIACTALAILIITIILCIIIICVCKRMRAKSKYGNPVEQEERENMPTSPLSEMSITQSIIQQALPRLNLSFASKNNHDTDKLVDKSSNPHSPIEEKRKSETLQANLSDLQASINAKLNEQAAKNEKTLTPNKWPLKPGVLVHVNENHTLKKQVKSELGVLERNENANNLDKNEKVVKKGRINLSKARSFFQSNAPTVITGEGVVSFKRPLKILAENGENSNEEERKEGARKRKKPGEGPIMNGGASGSNVQLSGAENPGLYENLPFHNMQTPTNKPIQAIQPRVVKPSKSIEALQKQLETNPSFAPRVLSCAPFMHNASKYTVIPTIYPTVLLNTYLPPMQKDYLDESKRKFNSLNTKQNRTSPNFQSLRVLRKRTIERFYPNTQYSDNFVEINNNKDDVIYENVQSSGDSYENITDSIQVHEETVESPVPTPAPRLSVTPKASPEKAKEHIYVNISFKNTSCAENQNKTHDQDNLIDRKESKNESYDTVDSTKPIVTAEILKTPAVRTGKSGLIKDGTKPSVPPKVHLPMFDRKNDTLPKRIIIPAQTMRVPIMGQKVLPKRAVPVKRSLSVQSHLPSYVESQQQPFIPDDQFIYADADMKDYGPINYKQASIYASMKKVKEQQKLQEIEDSKYNSKDGLL